MQLILSPDLFRDKISLSTLDTLPSGIGAASGSCGCRRCSIFLIIDAADKKSAGFTMISPGRYSFHFSVLTNNGPWRYGYVHVGSSSADGTKFAWHTQPPVSLSNTPVRYFQVLYLFKLFCVIRNKRRAKRVSVRPDQHVHRPDGLSCSFELRPDCSIFLNRFFIEVRYFEGKYEFIKGLLVFLDVPALGYAVAKFGKGYGRNADIADSMRFEMLEHFGGILFDEVNADIRIQHVLH
jgi:hypothetical protein